MPVDTPLMRFLERSQQLARLQGHIIAKVYADASSERDAIAQVEIKSEADIAPFLANLMPALEKSKERWADIPLMFQLFVSRYVDNFQSFIEELLSSVLKT